MGHRRAFPGQEYARSWLWENDCVMDKRVGRALDWLLCAIIGALFVLPLEMPTKLKAIWGHIRWALAV